MATIAAQAVLDRAFGKPRGYDPSKEQTARPKFDPPLLTPAELDRVEKALRLMVKASRLLDGEGAAEACALASRVLDRLAAEVARLATAPERDAAAACSALRLMQMSSLRAMVRDRRDGRKRALSIRVWRRLFRIFSVRNQI